MAWRPLLKFYRYAFAPENYVLLARAIGAALLVRRALHNLAGSSDVTPQLKAALPVIPSLYLPPQPCWKISESEKVAQFASLVVSFPFRWGRCLQQSLITWRLLNGYGIPARLYIGINRLDPEHGHVWVTQLSDNRALAEAHDPSQQFITIYSSPLPE